MHPAQIGPYKILRSIGEGGMGEVLLGEDGRLGRQAAIKILPAELCQSVDRRQRFLEEARSASAINHPHACVIYDVGETDSGQPFIAMEYVEGDTLRALVKQGPLATELAVEFGVQIAQALQAAHEARLIHRDIKSTNVMIDKRGHAKVLDFGLAKRIDDEQRLDETQAMLTIEGQVVGTPTHMSPEQAVGKEVDHRSDLFSLGVVFYEMLTGRLPFGGDSLGEITQQICQQAPPAMARFNYELPQELERITMKCLQKDPGRRYQSAADLTVDLRNLIAALSQQQVDSIPVEATQSMVQVVSHPGGSSMPSATDIQQSDILISCSQLDNQPHVAGGEGWISRFQRNLKIRLEQLTGDRMQVSFCEMPAGDTRIETTVLEAIPDASTMVAVLSPPFAKSKGCTEGTEKYWQGVERMSGGVAAPKALFKVVKTPVDDGALEAPVARIFQQLLGHDFFDRDPETSRIREYDETYGEEAAQRYYEKVYDLAYEIAEVAKARSQSAAATSDRNQTSKRIYLAETTSDLKEARDVLRREFLEQGHLVYPDRGLPIEQGELEQAVTQYLEQCDVIIQPVGARYGFVPEGGNESVIAIQNRLSRVEADRRDVSRLIWVPRELVVHDDRQRTFLDALRQEPGDNRRVELVKDSIENFKELVEHRWEAERVAERNSASSMAAHPLGSAARIYLLYESRDEAAVEPLEDYFYEQGIEVMLPEFEGDEHQITAVHIQNLTDCDAVLVYYGSSGKSWVDIKVRELSKAVGYRDGRSIDKAAVFIGAPSDRRKERFKSLSADVFVSTGEALDVSLLETFCDDVKRLKASSL
ncbi:MAG: protein kinase [Planctomycetota bacterium]|nr:protein kinase [Planctomycetota bacterium]